MVCQNISRQRPSEYVNMIPFASGVADPNGTTEEPLFRPGPGIKILINLIVTDPVFVAGLQPVIFG